MDVTHLLQSYYNNFYPFDLIYNYLQKTPYREFTITLQNNVYIRALSFTSSDEMKIFVMKKIPAKIDVGPIYTTLPEQGTEMLPLKKELVFDIDLTDYKRNCCQGKTLCDLCFTLIKCAAKIMDFVLSEHFGFQKILYVFSGGRGLHIWVSDESAQYLDDYERKQISTYFQKLIKQKY
ncbi:p48 polypeptide of DNA primase, partial [Conglomerata obtusa]